MLGMLTSIIGVVARGRNAKSVASAILPGIAGVVFGPELLEQFQSGVSTGLSPAAHAAGMAFGGLLAGGVNAFITWVSPKNKD